MKGPKVLAKCDEDLMPALRILKLEKPGLGKGRLMTRLPKAPADIGKVKGVV